MSQTSIPANEAESHFADLLARAERGEQVAIHRDGVHVATLVPAERSVERAQAAVARIKARRERILKENRGLSTQEILEARDEGRR